MTGANKAYIQRKTGTPLPSTFTYLHRHLASPPLKSAKASLHYHLTPLHYTGVSCSISQDAASGDVVVVLNGNRAQIDEAREALSDLYDRIIEKAVKPAGPWDPAQVKGTANDAAAAIV